MIETIASTYFEFFPGDFIVLGIIVTAVWYVKQKENKDFE